MMKNNQISALANSWARARRWEGVKRLYRAEDVVRLSGTIQPECTLARLGAERLWRLLHDEPYVKALGSTTGNQALQQVRAGLNVVCVDNSQVTVDTSDIGEVFPCQNVYSTYNVPNIVKRINNAFLRADQMQHVNGEDSINCFAPIVADAGMGLGGPFNAFELMKEMVEAGAAAVHFGDQSSTFKKRGHFGGKVIIPATEFISKLTAARLATDILGIPTILMARTEALTARLIQSDVDPIDQPFLTGDRTNEGYFYLKGGMEYAITRAIEFAPYVDVLWCETITPDLSVAREFAEAVHSRYPRKLLAYNCSPSSNWKRCLSERDILSFHDQLGLMGYKFQFVSINGFHTQNASMFELAKAYAKEGLVAYTQLQDYKHDLDQPAGYSGDNHRQFNAISYFDEIQMAVSRRPATAGSVGEESIDAQQFV